MCVGDELYMSVLQAHSCDLHAVFPTSTKDSSTITLDTLRQICEAVTIPVVAIGGMTADNSQATVEAGCAGVAVVSAIFGVSNPAASAQKLRQAIDYALEAQQ